MTPARQQKKRNPLRTKARPYENENPTSKIGFVLMGFRFDEPTSLCILRVGLIVVNKYRKDAGKWLISTAEPNALNSIRLIISSVELSDKPCRMLIKSVRQETSDSIAPFCRLVNNMSRQQFALIA